MEAFNDIGISLLTVYVINNWYTDIETICQVDNLNFKSEIIENFKIFYESFTPAASPFFLLQCFNDWRMSSSEQTYQASNIFYEIPGRLVKGQ